VNTEEHSTNSSTVLSFLVLLDKWIQSQLQIPLLQNLRSTWWNYRFDLCAQTLMNLFDSEVLRLVSQIIKARAL
jgi:hypothetical protein